MTASSRWEAWPVLPLDAWSDTYATLHLWTQIVGKVRLAQSPWLNHSRHVTLYVTARGLTTSPIPHGTRSFQIDFDFIDDQLTVQSSDGRTGHVALEPQSFAAFYGPVAPREAFYSTDLREFILPYDVVRQSPSADETLLEFLQTTYVAAATLGEVGSWLARAVETVRRTAGGMK
jgi:hypothetical protein